MAEWLRGRGVEHLYTSPLRRARETAVAISLATRAPVVELDALREVDVGELDGRRDEAAWRLYDHTVAAWHRGDLRARFPGGESFAEALLRMHGALEEVIRRHRHDEVVLVGHGEIFTSVLLRLLRLDESRGLAPASITSVRCESAGLVCANWGSTGHLYPPHEAGLRGDPGGRDTGLAEG